MKTVGSKDRVFFLSFLFFVLYGRRFAKKGRNSKAELEKGKCVQRGNRGEEGKVFF